MKATLYESVGLLLMTTSLYVFYRAIDFLTANDYIGAVITTLIGFIILRGGVDLSRMGVFLDADQRPSKP